MLIFPLFVIIIFKTHIMYINITHFNTCCKSICMWQQKSEIMFVVNIQEIYTVRKKTYTIVNFVDPNYIFTNLAENLETICILFLRNKKTITIVLYTRDQLRLIYTSLLYTPFLKHSYLPFTGIFSHCAVLQKLLSCIFLEIHGQLS